MIQMLSLSLNSKAMGRMLYIHHKWCYLLEYIYAQVKMLNLMGSFNVAANVIVRRKLVSSFPKAKPSFSLAKIENR